MSTPITPTEAHKALWNKLYNLAYDETFGGPSSDEAAIKLIADSEARAVTEMASRIQAAFHEPLIKERDQLRAECKRLTNRRDNLLKPLRERAEARAEKAEAEVERLTKSVDEMHTAYGQAHTRAERAEAEVVRLKDQLAFQTKVADNACAFFGQRENTELRAELATERARLDFILDKLRCDGETRADIDSAMRHYEEDAK